MRHKPRPHSPVTEAQTKSPVAVITGASGGLGTVVTDVFLKSSHRVSAIALDWPQPLRETDSCRVFTADLTSRAQAELVVAETLTRWGGIDFMLHLVGSWVPGERVEETSDEVWDGMLAVNLRTAFNMMRAVIPGMRARRTGRIVVIGSTSMLQPVMTWSAFDAAMGGLGALVQVAAAELRDEGVTVNALLPTTIDTPLVRSYVGDAEAPKWVDPHSLASLMLWLCSDAGRDVTGALIPVMGRQPHPCYHFHGSSDAPRRPPQGD